jgi:phosphate starvation-inducible protein PhoH and related proteins
MSLRKTRTKSECRQERKVNRNIRHKPLLDLVAEEQIRKRPVRPKKIELKPLTEAQAQYDSAINSSLITFGIGPAGTGKTWWAAMRAAEALKAGRIQKIIVTRPAVEAGENMGFLPGDMNEKYEPYFRPVKDAFEEYFGSSHLEYLMKSGIIEARPLAFLRGATIKDTWLIADEMQNATATQFKLLLTRIGHNAKFIVNGDPTQCDLTGQQKSGLNDAVRRLSRVHSISIVRFERSDIVRSGICQDIVEAYESENIERTDSYNNVDEDDDYGGLQRTLGR